MADLAGQMAREAHLAWRQTVDMQHGLEAAERMTAVHPPIPTTAAELFLERSRPWSPSVGPETPARPEWANALARNRVAPGWIDIQIASGKEPWEVIRDSGTAPRVGTLPLKPDAPRPATGMPGSPDGRMPGFVDIMAWWFSMAPEERAIVGGANDAWIQGGMPALYAFWEATNFQPFPDPQVRLNWMIAMKNRGPLSAEQMRKLETEVGRAAADQFHHGP